MTVDLETLKALLGQRTHAEIAKLLGVSVITVRRKLKAAGLTRTYRDHSTAIPWTVPKGQDTHTFAQYLRELSAAADGTGPVVSVYHFRTAVNWARGLVSDGLDVRYSEERGWETFTAGEVSHIQGVYDRAMRRAMQLGA